MTNVEYELHFKLTNDTSKLTSFCALPADGLTPISARSTADKDDEDQVPCVHQGPLLLTWFNFDPNMDN